MKVLINNNGCDDTTEFELDLSEKEFNIILNFAKINNEMAKRHCQPTIAIYKNYKFDELNGYNIWYKDKNGNIKEFEDIAKIEGSNEE